MRTCVSTVFWLRNSSAAICGFVRRSTINRAICNSRSVSESSGEPSPLPRRVRLRDAAERELGRLGRRRHRRTRRGSGDGSPLDSLTERELQIARLIVDRRTNPQIAAELFLSPKTIETHVRNLFHKLGVSSRVDVARAVERADRDAQA